MSLRILHVTRTPLTVSAFLKPILICHGKRGHEVELAFGREDPVPEDFGVPVHRCAIRRGLGPIAVYRAVESLADILRRGHYDVVVAHMVLVGALARLAYARAGGPGRLVYASHGLACYPTAPAWQRWAALRVERGLARWTHSMIVLNSHDADVAHKNHLARDRIHRLKTVGIPYADIVKRVTAFDRTAYRRRIGLAVDRPLVCYAGRFIKAKGILIFLEIARRHLAKTRETCFAIAGSGPLEGRLRKAVTSQGLDANIKWLGWYPDVIGLLAASDVLLFPTLYEGSPIVVQEAMAAGTPVLTSAVPGPQDLIERDVDGLLVAPCDIDGFCMALTGLLADPDRRRAMARAAQDKAAAWDVRTWAPLWATAIESAAKARP